MLNDKIEKIKHDRSTYNNRGIQKKYQISFFLGKNTKSVDYLIGASPNLIKGVSVGGLDSVPQPLDSIHLK
jgi:hypothetical protein